MSHRGGLRVSTRPPRSSNGGPKLLVRVDDGERSARGERHSLNRDQVRAGAAAGQEHRHLLRTNPVSFSVPVSPRTAATTSFGFTRRKNSTYCPNREVSGSALVGVVVPDCQGQGSGWRGVAGRVRVRPPVGSDVIR